jgi:hypothetical protein
MTTTTELKTGCLYTLSIDHPALSPDKRERYDWRKADMEAGMEFTVRDCEWKGAVWQEIAALGPYLYQTVRVKDLPEKFLAALVLIEAPLASQHLRAQGRSNYALDILDVLLREGKITLADVQSAETTVDNMEPS